MDPLLQKIKQLTEAEQNLSKQLNALLEDYESRDIIQENEQLRQQTAVQEKKISTLETKLTTVEKENSQLRQALQEQILDEKLNLLKVSKQKLDTYFTNQKNAHANELTAFEQATRLEIDRLKKQAQTLLGKEKDQILNELKTFAKEVNIKIQELRNAQANKEQELLTQTSTQYDHFSAEGVSEETIQKRIKQNQMEMKIGLNWLNKLGILLIILGVGAAFRYSYTNWFNDYFKGALFFLLGAVMAAAGEYFYRKNNRTFALGLLGGGIAVLYGSVFFSYFLLEIIDVYTALALSVLVTATAVVLSLRYHSKTICSFGLIGGYLPLYSYLFAFGLDGTAVFAAMGYLTLLNISILWIAFQRQWGIVHYISFLFHIPSMLVLISLTDNYFVSMGYSIVTFLIYLGITMAYPLKNKVALKYADILLLAFNTFVSCTLLYFLFNQLGWDELRGLLALVFCALYFGLGKFMETSLPKEKQSIVLFYATSLTFAVLMIPFQFGMEWAALGWLVEGIVIMIYANRAKLATLEKAGWVILFLCLSIFFIEVYSYWTVGMPLASNFQFKYFAVSAGLLLVSYYYSWKQKNEAGFTFVFPKAVNFVRYFKYFTLGNLWVYFLYVTSHYYGEWVPRAFSHYHFYELMLMAFVSISLAYVLTKVPVLYDRIVKYYCLFLYGAGILLGLFVTLTIAPLRPSIGDNTAVEYIALGLLIFFNIFVFISGRELLLAFIRQQYKNLELYPLILGVYLMGIMAAFLTVQFHLGEVSLLFSSVFLLLAIGYIFYGFWKKYVYIRRLGLGVTILATAKLIFYDLSFLTEGSRIIAYFAFGVALLGISYMYQRVSNRQERGGIQ